jgi:hypothetical protein
MSQDYMSRGNSEGTSLGQSATDKVSIFGGTPVVQPSGNAQAAITRGLACGSICTFATALTPGGVLTITTTGASMPVITPGTGASWTVAANDLVVLNKPTAQAGLGVGCTRISAAGVVGLTFSNFSAATVTATAGEKYAMVAIRGFGVLTAALTPSPVLANTIVEQQFTVTGVRAGEVAIVSKAAVQAGLDVMGCRVVSNNVVGITFGNVTAATITPTAGETYQVFSVGGIDAVNNELLVQATATPGLITSAACTAINVVVSTIAASDVVTGVMKPTAQTGVTATGGFVSAAGALGIVFCNPTAGGLTPTANEVYHAKLYRPNPVAPCSIISTTLSPSSVAANTTAEQTFTVTGIVAGTVVAVNSQAPQAGLGIVGVRVSGTNSVCITFGNSTAAAITPTPSSTYVFADFNLPFDAAGVSVVQTGSAVDQGQSLLTNAIRSALVAITGMAGA